MSDPATDRDADPDPATDRNADPDTSVAPAGSGTPVGPDDTSGDGADGPFDCPYCDRRFARADWLALHEGLDHGEALSPDERAAYEAAREAEVERLRLFRYKALGALVLLYFGFVLLYAVSL